MNAAPRARTPSGSKHPVCTMSAQAFTDAANDIQVWLNSQARIEWLLKEKLAEIDAVQK